MIISVLLIMYVKCLPMGPEICSLNKHLFLLEPRLGAGDPMMNRQTGLP